MRTTTRESHPPHRTRPPLTDPTWQRRSERCSFVRKTPVPISAFAAALNARASQIVVAAIELEARLVPCGMRVRFQRDTVRLVPTTMAAIDPQALEFLVRRTLGRRWVDRQRAGVLYRTLVGVATGKNTVVTNPGKVSLCTLVNAGMIVRPDADTEALQLSADVRESLFLDDTEMPVVPRAPIVGVPRQFSPDRSQSLTIGTVSPIATTDRAGRKNPIRAVVRSRISADTVSCRSASLDRSSAWPCRLHDVSNGPFHRR